MHRKLVLDTAGRQVRLATLEGKKTLADIRFTSVHHVRELTIHIKSILAQSGWSMDSINVIGVNTGPGTFTGIRVGLSVAKAICYAQNIKLVAVDMFDGFAQGLWFNGDWPNDCQELDVLLEGQLQSCSLVRYRINELGPERLFVRTFPQTEIAEHCQSSIPVTGVLDRFIKYLPESLHVIGRPPWDETRPNIGSVVLDRIDAARFDDPMTIEPYYVRPSSAEEKWAARQV